MSQWKQRAEELAFTCGWSWRKVALEVGVAKSTVSDYLRERVKERLAKEDVSALPSITESVLDPASGLLKIIRKNIKDKYVERVVEDIVAKRPSQEVYKKDSGSEDNSRILLVSDLHIPYHHKDTLKFLQHLKNKYNPTRVICLGDEVDHLALSYHEKETEAPSAFDELEMALPVIKQVEEMFPIMDILDSNHGSLAYRKAKTAGIPKHYLKSYAMCCRLGMVGSGTLIWLLTYLLGRSVIYTMGRVQT